MVFQLFLFALAVFASDKEVLDAIAEIIRGVGNYPECTAPVITAGKATSATSCGTGFTLTANADGVPTRLFGSSRLYGRIGITSGRTVNKYHIPNLPENFGELSTLTFMFPLAVFVSPNFVLRTQILSTTL